MIYERLLRPLLFALDPETAHQFALGCLRVTGRLCPRPTAKTTGVSAFGLNFRHRVGLAAGLDKNGVALPAWEALQPSLPADRAPLPALTPAVGPRRARVAMLTGCVQSIVFAAHNRATARVLARNGCDVLAPEGQG